MPAQSFLMIPDSLSDRIILFDPNDGSLVDDNFIDGSGIFQTPLNAVQVEQEIWVSDQVADAIFRFDLQGNYLSVVGDNDGDGDTDGLDNIRGIEFVDGLVYVANGGDENDAPGDGEVVVVFDPEGNNLGFFDTGAPYDIRAYNGELLINDINSEDDGGEDIDRYSIDGIDSSFLGTFVDSDGETGIDFPQQITLRESNGNVLVGGFSTPGGIYEYDVAGNQINLFDADDGFANRLRAAYELDNGNIIWSGGDGVIVTDPDTGEDNDIYTVNDLDFRPSVRYIEPLIVPKGDRNVSGAIFLADQTLDTLYLTQDLSGDGDANDPLEVSVYFDGTNASGLSDPTSNIFTVLQGERAVYYGDGGTYSVYRLIDYNRDGDALDIQEANVWFDASNSASLPLLTPNGLAQDSTGAIYIVEADTVGTPNGDFVYRTEDLNGDGDANDVGEASVWLDLKELNPNSSPFEITFIDDVAYIIDSVGGDPNVIYRAEDLDSSGSIEANEVSILVDETQAPIDFGLDSDRKSLFTVELIDFAEPQSVFKIEDGATTTTTEVWNSTALPEGYALGAAFSIAADADGELAITSNGGDANEDNVFRLLDLNEDGDYFDAGETIPYLSGLLTSTVPERARVVEYAEFNPPAKPQFGTEDNDNLRGTFANDILFGLGGSDRLGGSIGNDLLDGGQGEDTISGSFGNDTILGGTEDDLLRGQIGDNLINGEAGADRIYAGIGHDTVFGGTEDDFIRGQIGNDVISGDAGSDLISGNGGNDSIFGGADNDFIRGNNGDDLLSGDAGNDRIQGGLGDDLLMGVTGDDTLHGGFGNDIFVFGNGDGSDFVSDFNPRRDFIGLVEGLTFADISLTQSGKNTILGVTATGEELATLKRVDATDISESNFVSVPDISDIGDVL